MSTLTDKLTPLHAYQAITTGDMVNAIEARIRSSVHPAFASAEVARALEPMVTPGTFDRLREGFMSYEAYKGIFKDTFTQFWTSTLQSGNYGGVSQDIASAVVSSLVRGDNVSASTLFRQNVQSDNAIPLPDFEREARRTYDNAFADNCITKIREAAAAGDTKTIGIYLPHSRIIPGAVYVALSPDQMTDDAMKNKVRVPGSERILIAVQGGEYDPGPFYASEVDTRFAIGPVGYLKDLGPASDEYMRSCDQYTDGMFRTFTLDRSALLEYLGNTANSPVSLGYQPINSQPGTSGQ